MHNIDKIKINTQTFQCYTFDNWLVVESKLSQQEHKVLKINRKTREIVEVNKSQIKFQQQPYIKRAFSCFLGICIVEELYFLAFCQQCIQVTTDNNLSSFQIKSVFMVSYLKDQELNATGKKQKIFRKLNNLNELLSYGFYFSLRYDLTNTLKNQQNRFNQIFAWNRNYLKEIDKYNFAKKWSFPIIQGFISSFHSYIDGHKVHYILISRRSCEKGGTRYFDRGVNEEGFVANYVESQQIVILGEYTASDVQIRGSVPIYFEQKGLKTKINISRSNQLTRKSFLKHFELCQKHYLRTFCVNLLAKRKKGEHSITQEYQKHIKQAKNQKIKYMHYDFHEECSNDKFYKVNSAISKVSNIKAEMCFYVFDKTKGMVVQTQDGIFRTNCLDCLDRTNFFQAKLALQTLQLIFNYFLIDVKSSIGCTLIEEMDKTEKVHAFVKNFKHVWADNGDQISYHYTGTGSTHTDITREGTRKLKGTLTHKFKSITRFYNQNFWDFHKMKLIDQILQSNNSYMEAYTVPNMLKLRERQFASFEKVSVNITTWKISNTSPPKEILEFKSDVVVVGLQEVESASVLNYYSSSDCIKKWNSYLEKCSAGYTELIRNLNSNAFIVVYVKNKYKQRVRNIETSYVKFSSYFNKYLSNKCALIIRFYFDNTSLIFGNCQLQYGRQYMMNRVFNINQIYNSAFQMEEVGKKKTERIDLADYKFIFGNLNFHLQSQNQTAANKIKQKLNEIIRINSQEKKDEKMQISWKQNMSQILKYDQFDLIKEQCTYLRQYRQPEINFIPSYKYVKGKKILEESKNNGWVDRVIYETEKFIQNVSYGVLPMYYSDHLPVNATFTIQVEQEDENKKEEIYNQILSELKLNKSIEEDQQED